eukprot:TRINITY_DN633_c0_g7_i1.p2 TRINITY_DN633_c0_g7~~TRINITY_DN633_c0_g7_i1.p2  ORF type:complete len:137 (-),score=15.86 TRINITY_DN633_c0_g7_i1:16-426(-)
MMNLVTWALLSPFVEVYLSVFNCEDSHHKFTESMKCFGGLHIFIMVLSIILVVILLTVALLGSIFFKETHLNKDNAHARLENNCAILLFLYRLIFSVENTFISHVSFVVILGSLSLIHICRCRRYAVCRSRWSPYH